MSARLTIAAIAAAVLTSRFADLDERKSNP
jgi:hypothetical protein